MKFVLACYGTRGDIEPGAAVGRELLRRGHDVRMAVPPDMVGFLEAAGLAAVPFGPDTQAPLEAGRKLSTCFFHSPWRIRELITLARQTREFGIRWWEELSATLVSLADEADLLLTGQGLEGSGINVAEYYDIPFATYHYSPIRANGQLAPFLPPALTRAVMTVSEWVQWRLAKKLVDAQRRELGLPKATSPAPRRIAERGSLEIQAYDEVCFPMLAAEWTQFGGRRPFVGALTLELPTDADDEVASWIAAGTPPIYFGFGSVPVGSPGNALEMISAACAQLGQRALVCAGGTDFSHVPHLEHVKVVDAVNHSAAFPACRAVVHGGTGATSAALRAGVPQLILWTLPDHALWGAVVKRLKVGIARRLSSTTRESLVSDLRTILAPQYVTRAREIATRMSKPAESVALAADLLEKFASSRRIS